MCTLTFPHCLFNTPPSVNMQHGAFFFYSLKKHGGGNALQLKAEAKFTDCSLCLYLTRVKGRQLTALHYAPLAAVHGGEAQRQLPNYHIEYAVNAPTSGPLANNTEELAKKALSVQDFSLFFWHGSSQSATCTSTVARREVNPVKSIFAFLLLFYCLQLATLCLVCCSPFGVVFALLNL